MNHLKSYLDNVSYPVLLAVILIHDFFTSKFGAFKWQPINFQQCFVYFLPWRYFFKCEARIFTRNLLFAKQKVRPLKFSKINHQSIIGSIFLLTEVYKKLYSSSKFFPSGLYTIRCLQYLKGRLSLPLKPKNEEGVNTSDRV